MAKRINPQAAVEKWAKNAAARQADYVAGIESMTVNPMEAAAAAQDKYAQGVQDAVNNNRYADGCRSVSLQTLKQIAKDKGGAAYSRGVSATRPEKKARQAAAIADSQQVADSVNASHSTMTLEERIAKSAEYQRQRAALKGGRR